jgi:methylglutaconyl-CoA hydratase
LLKIHEEKNIAFISLNRPEVKNAFNPQMIQQLTGAFIQFSKRSDLRAIVLSGEGNVFCAGADLNWMQNMIQYSLDQNKKDSTELFEMFEAIESCQVPVITVLGSACVLVCMLLLCMLFAFKQTTQHDSVGYVC